MKFTVDTSRLDRVISKMDKAVLRRGVPEFMREQARGIVRTAIGLTPPASPEISGVKAKKVGELMVETDIQKVFRGVPKSRAKTTNLAHLHRQNRHPRTGRTRRRRNQHEVYKVNLNQYIRYRKSKVGYLAAGWNLAAAKMGVKPPAWIWRHAGAGSVELRVTAGSFHFKMINRTRYAHRVKGMERRLQFAVNAQAGKLERKLEYLLKREAEKASASAG